MLKGRVWWRGRVEEAERHPGGEVVTASGATVPENEARFLTPSQPSKIVCIGRNYVAHARELGNTVPERPLIFLKPPSALLDPGGTIVLPPDSHQVDYEGEIAVVMGRTCRNLAQGDDPLPYVAGVTPLNDVTARDLQRLDVQFTRAKSFDTFCPFGPWIVPVTVWDGLSVTTLLNGRLVQQGQASEMAFSIPDLIRFISRVMTLLPGDVIATGTPEGVGPLAPGDRIAVEVAGVRLDNDVRS